MLHTTWFQELRRDSMGRIKTSFVKHIGQDLFEKHAGEFTTDFYKNKEVLKKLATSESKHIQNIVAGYITTLKKQESR